MSDASTSNSILSDRNNSGYLGLTTFVAIIITIGICWAFCGLTFTLACFQRMQRSLLEGRPLDGALTRGARGSQEGSNDSGGVEPAIKEVLLVCDEGVGLDTRQDDHVQPLSVHPRALDSLLDVSFFIRMPKPHTAVASSLHMSLDLLKDELLIATMSTRQTTVSPQYGKGSSPGGSLKH